MSFESDEQLAARAIETGAYVHGGSDWLEKAVKEHTFEERASLTVEEQKAQSWFAKALVKAKIARLWFRGMREVVKGLPNAALRGIENTPR